MQRLVDENKIDLNNMVSNSIVTQYKYRIRKIGMMLQAIWIEDQDGIVVFSGKRYSIHN